MAYVHEFGIIDCIENYREDQYEPEKYNCISVDGDLIYSVDMKLCGKQIYMQI